MNIKFNDLSKQWDIIREETLPRLEELFKKSDFIGGKAIEEFEKNFSNYCNTKYAVGVSNGTDALKISLAALDLKSPCGIIIPANTFIATALAITYLSNINYEIILIDCDQFYQIDVELLESYLKEYRRNWKSCVIIPVHLYGHPANMKRVIEIAKDFECFILEDASQAHGSIVLNKKVGGLGDISAFSLYPGKNLGAAGDAGIITTNDEELFNKVKALRNYGSFKKYEYEYRGWNNRLDTIQAIILDSKLKYLDKWNNMRIDVANKYNRLLHDNSNFITPKQAPYIDKQIYHIYAIRVKNRDDFQTYLAEHNIPTIIHYPIPIQKTKPFKYLDHFDNKRALQYANELLSLPIYPFLDDVEIEYITETINNYF
ncbi:MAG: DegT/DnrJ/EryC1/StrS family aminotransferase [Candidatus Hodarchaeota archaeon]